jgi:hypothetical protein
MRIVTSVLAALLVPAFMLVAAVATPAMAQDKAMGKMKKAAGQVTIKEVTQDGKVRVYEAIFKPGAEAPSIERSFRVVRYLKGGTLQRTYPDGKKENTTYKNGEVKIFPATKPYAIKNVGKTTVHAYVVSLK